MSAGASNLYAVDHGCGIASRLLRRPTVLWVTGAILLIQALLAGMDLPGWICPIRAAIGLPCPACGLSRATVAMVTGDPVAATFHHPLIWVLAPAGLFLGASSLLPARARLRMAEKAGYWEARTHAGAWLIGLFLLVGLIRLAWAALQLID